MAKHNKIKGVDMRKNGLIILLLMCLVVSCVGSDQRRIKQERAEAKRNLGVKYMKNNNYAMALRELQGAEKLYADDPDLQHDLGYAYMQRGRLDLAITHYKKALELKPDYPSARNNMGTAYLRKEEWDTAIAIFKELTQNLLYRTPQNPLFSLGWAYYNKKEYLLSEKYYKEALQLYGGGVTKDAVYIRALNGLSLTYMEVGKGKKAVELLELAIKDAPQISRLYFDLANAYTLCHDYEKALRAYNKVIELDPGSELAREANNKVQKIKELK
jgi:type IV pilus assembly protein PilF